MGVQIVSVHAINIPSARLFARQMFFDLEAWLEVCFRKFRSTTTTFGNCALSKRSYNGGPSSQIRPRVSAVSITSNTEHICVDTNGATLLPELLDEVVFTLVRGVDNGVTLGRCMQVCRTWMTLCYPLRFRSFRFKGTADPDYHWLNSVGLGWRYLQGNIYGLATIPRWIPSCLLLHRRPALGIHVL